MPLVNLDFRLLIIKFYYGFPFAVHVVKGGDICSATIQRDRHTKSEENYVCVLDVIYETSTENSNNQIVI